MSLLFYHQTFTLLYRGSPVKITAPIPEIYLGRLIIRQIKRETNILIIVDGKYTTNFLQISQIGHKVN